MGNGLGLHKVKVVTAVTTVKVDNGLEIVCSGSRPAQAVWSSEHLNALAHFCALLQSEEDIMLAAD